MIVLCSIMFLMQIPLIILAVWCVLNEQRLIEWEEKISKNIAAKMQKRKTLYNNSK